MVKKGEFQLQGRLKATDTLQVMYFAHIHPANQSGLLLRDLATASQPVVIPGMRMKVEVEVSPEGRLWAAVGTREAPSIAGDSG